MIIDQLENLNQYPNIPYVQMIHKFVKENDLLALPEGDIEIDGQDLFVKVMSSFPRKADEAHFEIHQEYTDVQVVLRGCEMMQTVRPADLEEEVQVDMEGDFKFYQAQKNISSLIVGPQGFVVFFPGEPHKPGCECPAIQEEIFKLVFKARTR